MLEKLERPPLGIEDRQTQRQTSQTRGSLKVSRIWSFLRWAFCVPLWLSFTRRSAATFSASVNLWALTGLSGRRKATSAPITTVMMPIARKKIRQLARCLLCVNETP